MIVHIVKQTYSHMNTFTNQKIKILQETVNRNKVKIELNRVVLRSLLQYPNSDIRTNMFINCFEENLQLFSNNYKVIKLQYA
jgi:hypothetical protein